MFVNCTFEDNLVTEFGGGMEIHGRSKLFNCIFVGNSALQFGGGIADSSNGSVLANCTFSSNWGRNYGGGIWSYQSNNLLLVNCTFSDNESIHGGGINLQGSSNSTLTGCVLWGNSAAGIVDEAAQINVLGTSPVVTYSCIQGLNMFSGNGNIGLDPLFVDADGSDDIFGTVDDNLRLLATSPCIDAADNTAVPPDQADLDGDGNTAERLPLDLDARPRFMDDRDTIDTGVADPPHYRSVVDMGAYEFPLVRNLDINPASQADPF